MLPPPLEHLLSPEAYPHPVGTLQLVETHISWVLLTGDFAYKIKRPVRFPFVDLRSFEHRAWLCEQEVALNRRFAPEIYLEVCRITADASGACVNGTGAVLEHAVKMRQFDRGNELDSLLEAGAIEPAELEHFGADLARIHAGLPVAAADSHWGVAQSVRAAIIRNFEECLAAAAVLGDTAELSALRPRIEESVEATMPVIAERHGAGKVRECHGDLHCGNVVRLGSRLVAFDCLEFEPAFRWIDVGDEIAFLSADLESFGRPVHAMAFLRGYLAHSGDYQACRVHRTYAVHRSLVRAKVAALSVGNPADSAALRAGRHKYRRYFRCAWKYLSAPHPRLVLMSGFSGSGKTWLARRLAPLLGAVHLRSDVERKRLAGLSERERSGSSIGEGLYSAAMTRQVNQHLVSAARFVLQGGFTTIVDATFNRRTDRELFANLARELHVPALVIRCNAPEQILRSRISTRTREATDASEADVAVLEWQMRHHEPPSDEEGFVIVEAHTDHPDVVDRTSACLVEIDPDQKAGDG